MATRRVSGNDSSKSPTKRYRPATTPEDRENQLIALAVDLTERQMREGTASSQVITHYLKLGSTREQLEQDKLRSENALLRAKIDDMGTAKNIEALYREALGAMKAYQGNPTPDEEDDDY